MLGQDSLLPSPSDFPFFLFSLGPRVQHFYEVMEKPPGWALVPRVVIFAVGVSFMDASRAMSLNQGQVCLPGDIHLETVFAVIRGAGGAPGI